MRFGEISIVRFGVNQELGVQAWKVFAALGGSHSTFSWTFHLL
jgi:hypothetical protein